MATSNHQRISTTLTDVTLAGEHRLERRHEARVRVTRLEALRVSSQIAPLDLEQVKVCVVERRHQAVPH